MKNETHTNLESAETLPINPPASEDSAETELDITKRRQAYIHIDKLMPSPMNTFPTEDYAELKWSIECMGVLDPLIVTEAMDDKYIILAGCRRYRAVNELVKEGRADLAEVPCHIIESDESKEKLLDRFVTEIVNMEVRDNIDINAHRLHIIELAHQMAESGELRFRSIVSHAVKYLHVSPRYARMYNQIFKKANPELIEHVKNNEIPVSAASRLAGLPPKDQAPATQEVLGGSPIGQVMKKYNEVKPEAKPQPTEVPGQETINDIFHANTQDSAKANEKLHEIPVNEPVPEPAVIDEAQDQGDMGDTGDTGNVKRVTYGTNFNPAFDSPFEGDDDFDLPPVDFMNMDTGVTMDLDTTRELSSLKRDTSNYDNANYKSKLNTVLDWCKKMLDKDEPTDEEWQVLEACREVAERFF